MDPRIREDDDLCSLSLSLSRYNHFAEQILSYKPKREGVNALPLINIAVYIYSMSVLQVEHIIQNSGLGLA